jgi:phytanoyl-CoA hydroxylase
MGLYATPGAAYTCAMSTSDEDVWYFQHSGYLRLAQTLSDELVTRLNAATDREIAARREPIVWEEGEGRMADDVRRLSKIIERDPVYLEAATQPFLLDAIEAALGPHIELLTNKHNHLMVRPPGSGVVPWHSGEEPYEATLVTALIYLEESTLENGCVRIVPGSHRRPFRQQRRYPGGDFYENPLYYRALPVPMPKGGILLFNDCCYHGADTNDSQHSRRSLTLGYRAHDAHAVDKNDPEKIIVRGERVYTGHPHPFPNLPTHNS